MAEGAGPELAIHVRDLHKAYGDNEAVRGIDLDIAVGEIFGFLGPNGAGKSTTIEILEGYRKRTRGEAWVLGADPGKPTREWRERIGLVLQDCRARNCGHRGEAGSDVGAEKLLSP